MSRDTGKLDPAWQITSFSQMKGAETQATRELPTGEMVDRVPPRFDYLP